MTTTTANTTTTAANTTTTANEGTMTDNATANLAAIRQHLNTVYLSRGFQIDLLLVAVIGGLNGVLIGPPGTAKSQLCRETLHLTVGTDHVWAKQFNPFTTKDEVFGFMDIKAMKDHGEYRTDTRGRITAPGVHAAFFDEVFKAFGPLFSGTMSITHTGERAVDLQGDPAPRKTEVETILAASNELPPGFGGRRADQRTDFTAFWDRWTLRSVVQSTLTDEQLVRILRMQLNRPTPPAALTKAERRGLQQAARDVQWKDKNPLIKAFRMAEQKGMSHVTARRLGELMHATRAHAVLHGRDYCHLEDYRFAVKAGFWQDFDDFDRIREIIAEMGTEADKRLDLFWREIDRVQGVYFRDLENVSSLDELTVVSQACFEAAQQATAVFNQIPEAELSTPGAKDAAREQIVAWRDEMSRIFHAHKAELSKPEVSAPFDGLA